MKMPKLTLRGFVRPHEAIIASLDSLERQTFEEVWRQKEVSVRQFEISFCEKIAYTSIMTTLIYGILENVVHILQ